MQKFNPIGFKFNPYGTSNFHDDSFAQYETILKMIEFINQLIESMSEGSDEIEELKVIKVSLNDMINKYKLSPNGDFKGTWHGLTLHESSEGLASDWNEAKGIYPTVKDRFTYIDSLIAETVLKLGVVGIIPEVYGRLEGETDDTGMLQRAITLGNATKKPINLLPNKIYLVSGSLGLLDVNKSSLHGIGSIIQFSGMNNGHGLDVISSADYTNNIKNTRVAISGIQFFGGTSTSKLSISCLFLGRTVNTPNQQANAMYSIQNVAIQGFNYNIEFGNNAWRISFLNLNSRWGQIYAPTGLSDMGENINFNNCMINDGGSDVILGTGEFMFDNCSFDNVTLRGNGDVTIFCNKCHFENPGYNGAGYRYVSCENNNTNIFIDNSSFIFNTPTSGSFNQALCYCADSVVVGGIHFGKMKLFENSGYQPWLTDENAVLVAGKGRVTFNGVWATWLNNFNMTLSKYSNQIDNGDAEINSIRGWNIRHLVGTGTTLGIESENIKHGLYSFKMNIPSGNTGVVYQKIPIKAGQTFMGQWYDRCVINGTGAMNVRFRIFNSKDELLLDNGYSAMTTTTAWNTVPKRTIGGYAPSGSSYAEIQIYSNGVGGDNIVWFDDVIISVI